MSEEDIELPDVVLVLPREKYWLICNALELAGEMFDLPSCRLYYTLREELESYTKEENLYE
jgi:hypothetical protein